MIAIIDYGMGNKHSVYNALQFLGIDAVITRDPAEIAAADRLILPGVGAFGAAMANLHEYGLVPILNDQVVDKKKPFLGICLGMQLLAREGHEKGIFAGLGWLEGEVRELEPQNKELRLPHIGWNDIEIVNPHPLLEGMGKDRAFYFVHSQVMQLSDSSQLAAVCDYGGSFAAVVARDNIFATQFHPEKSQKVGLKLLERFAEWEGVA